jgi:hypothetical protein
VAEAGRDGVAQLGVVLGELPAASGPRGELPPPSPLRRLRPPASGSGTHSTSHRASSSASSVPTDDPPPSTSSSSDDESSSSPTEDESRVEEPVPSSASSPSPQVLACSGIRLVGVAHLSFPSSMSPLPTSHRGLQRVEDVEGIGGARVQVGRLGARAEDTR